MARRDAVRLPSSSAVQGNARPRPRTERLFEGAVTLSQKRVLWGAMRAELMTMERGSVVQNDVLIGTHVLFMGIEGKPHVTTVEAEGVPRWQGTKGKGASAFFPAGRRMRSWHAQGRGTTLMLFFDDHAFENLLHREKKPNWQSRPSADDAFIAASSMEIASALMDEHDDLASLRAETIATGLHLYAARRFSDLAEPRRMGGDGINRAIDLIHATLPRAASLAELYAVSGLPQAQLLAGFRARTGLSPHQYIIRERLSRAQFLLSTTSRSLAEIALEVGCANPEHLGQMFRQRARMSPQAWRRLNDRR